MSYVVIGAEELKLIEQALAMARANPIPLQTIMGLQHETPGGVLKLKDRKQPLERPESQHVVFPGGFRASISFEQQPGGLAVHLSISAPKQGRIPNPYVVKLIAQAFGLKMMQGRGHLWLEEFEPGHHAINIVEYV